MRKVLAALAAIALASMLLAAPVSAKEEKEDAGGQGGSNGNHGGGNHDENGGGNSGKAGGNAGGNGGENSGSSGGGDSGGHDAGDPGPKDGAHGNGNSDSSGGAADDASSPEPAPAPTPPPQEPGSTSPAQPPANNAPGKKEGDAAVGPASPAWPSETPADARPVTNPLSALLGERASLPSPAPPLVLVGEDEEAPGGWAPTPVGFEASEIPAAPTSAGPRTVGVYATDLLLWLIGAIAVAGILGVVLGRRTEASVAGLASLAVPGVDQAALQRLSSLGLNSVDALLSADPDALSFWAGLPSRTISDLQDTARLLAVVPAQAAARLIEVGIRSAETLASCQAEQLQAKMWIDGKATDVHAWIVRAQALVQLRPSILEMRARVARA